MVDCGAAREAMLSRERGAALAPGVRDHLLTCATCAPAAAGLDELEEALAELADDVPVAPPPFETVARAARAAARGRRQLRRARRLLPVTLAFATAVAVTVVATGLLHRHDGRVAREGEVLDATRGIAAVALGDGAQVTVVAGRAVVAASNPARTVVRLESGTVLLSVPRLSPGHDLVVSTDEAEVRVHGTRFEVARESQGTRIGVGEGIVEVQPREPPGQAFFLGKGESRLVEALVERRRRARTVALGSLDQRDDSTAAEKIRLWLATDPPDEEAAEAHALLAWKRSRDGDRAGALASYRRALALLPADRAPLWADNACAQLALLEEAEGAAAGTAAWRRYLDRFPGGVHAATARSHVAGKARETTRQTTRESNR